MICPDCLESYEFERFDVDEATLEHRGVFTCQCEEPLLLPEFLTRAFLEDNGMSDRLTQSRMLHLRIRRGTESARKAVPVEAKALKVNNIHLERYIRVFSEQSLKHLGK